MWLSCSSPIFQFIHYLYHIDSWFYFIQWILIYYYQAGFYVLWHKKVFGANPVLF